MKKATERYEHSLRHPDPEARGKRNPLFIKKIPSKKPRQLTADRATHTVYIDETVALKGVPDEAWQYRQGPKQRPGSWVATLVLTPSAL